MDGAIWGGLGLVESVRLLRLGLLLPVARWEFIVASGASYALAGAAFGCMTHLSSGGRRESPAPASLIASAVLRVGVLILWTALVRRDTGLELPISAVGLALVPIVHWGAVRGGRAAWAGALVVGAIAVPWPLPAPAARGDAPRVVLLTIDTLRADVLGAYGAADAHTERIDRLARQSIRFDNAVATAPFTIPSLTSMMTGRWVHRHGVRSNLHALDPGLVRVGDALSARDLRMVSATDLDLADAIGLDRGFRRRLHRELSVWDLPPLRQLLARWQTVGAWFDTADSSVPTTLAARRWLLLDAPAEDPFLLWIHYYDDAPHAPYDAPEPYRSLFDAPPFALEGTLAELEGLAAAGSEPSAEIANALRARYRGEVAWLDAQIGLLWRALEARGLWERSWIIIAADHGEQFGRDGVFQHGKSLRREVLRVPLIIKPPVGAPVRVGGEEAPGVARNLVSLADLAPTLLDIFGVEGDAIGMVDLDGRSLLADRSSNRSPRLVWSEAPALGSPRLGDRNPAICATRSDGWTLTLDPRTGANVLAPAGDDRTDVRSGLLSNPKVHRSLMTRFEQLRWTPPRPPDPNPRLREELKALGYAD